MPRRDAPVAAASPISGSTVSDAQSSDPAAVAAGGSAAQALIAASSATPAAAGAPTAPPGVTPGAAAPPGSRYAGLGTAIHRLPDGTEVAYFRRRQVPPPDALATIGREEVRPGDRADLVAARALGDPTRFWQICDANLAFDPAEIEAPGRMLRVALPAGFPGAGGGDA